jgi:hypothetical protein
MELDDDENPLNFYGVCDGAEILMNELDVKAQNQEANQLAEEQERKIAQQERDICALKELQRQQRQGIIHMVSQQHTDAIGTTQ